MPLQAVQPNPLQNLITPTDPSPQPEGPDLAQRKLQKAAWMSLLCLVNRETSDLQAPTVTEKTVIPAGYPTPVQSTPLLASLLGARPLLGAPGHTTSSKKLPGTSASLVETSALLVVTRTLLVARSHSSNIKPSCFPPHSAPFDGDDGLGPGSRVPQRGRSGGGVDFMCNPGEGQSTVKAHRL